MDVGAVRRAVLAQAARETAGITRIDAYCLAQNGDESHREVIGPLLSGAGASGVVVHDGAVVAGPAARRTAGVRLEQGQQADGSVRLPEALVPYAGFETIDPA